MTIALLSSIADLCFVTFYLWHLLITKAYFEGCKDVRPMANIWEGCVRFRGSQPAVVDQMRQFGYFLHITDLHVDKDYVQGTSEKSSCHRTPKPSQKLKVGRFGAPGLKCDSPVDLVKETLDWVSREWKGKLDFVIWTGDNARHDRDWKEPRDKKQVMELNQLVSEMVADRFRGVPVIPTLGNNDVYPHNEIIENDNLLEFYEQLWSAWVPTDGQQDGVFRKGGYFTVDVAAGRIRIISLNTIFFIKKNSAVDSCDKPGPARDQLAWFEDELRRARNNKVQVIVMGHVPPSPHGYRRTCFQGYIDLASEFSDVIISHHYGHLNMDHFLLYNTGSSADLKKKHFDSNKQKVLDDNDDHYRSISNNEITIARDIHKYLEWLFGLYESIDIDGDVLSTPPSQRNSPLIAIQVAPSVLPTYLPSVRVYKYALPNETNPSAVLLGYTQYYANITLWELSHPDEQLEYAIEYTTEEAYGLNDLSLASLFKMAKSMVEGGDKMKTEYMRNMFVRTKNDTIPGDIQ